MFLDYSKLPFDANGIPETPTLVLKTMGNKTIGSIPGIHNLKFNIKFSEPSEMSFDVPAIIDGDTNWIFDRLSGHKIIYTQNYGVYMTLNPSDESDGISDIKHVKAYSLEKSLENKRFFLEEGTFKFYDITNPYSPDTIIGRILEIAVGWKPGYISPTLAQAYRTFDQYDDYLLSFVYNSAPQKYRCVFVFDSYEKTISAYDADEEREMLPIYLDFDNLIDSLDVDEIDDELATAIRPYGSDGLDIISVNPIGTNWIYDISHFISNGDISSELADKWTAWQQRILNEQEHYIGLISLRASATARLLTLKAELSDLNGELDILKSQQSITIQTIASETGEGRAKQEEKLREINVAITNKKSEISSKEAVISDVETSLDASDDKSYSAQINAIAKDLSIKNNFSDEEYNELSNYFIEQDLSENTFVATDIDTTISGSFYELTNESFIMSNSDITEISMSDFNKTMYSISGGTFALSGSHNLSGDIIRGTLEVSEDDSYVLSLYAGSIVVTTDSQTSSPSGVIVVSGVLSDFDSDIHSVTVDKLLQRMGSYIQFISASGSLYLTANISEYKKYSVQSELYDYAVNILRDLATPTYEFSVDSANFIFSQEFAPFRNKLKLGSGVYMNVRGKMITPYIIELALDFEDHSDFSLVFSNRFKRHDNCNTLKDMIEQSYSSSRNFDAGKYIYNQSAEQSSMVSKFMNSSLDAAKNTIIGASNQSVIIDGAGIHVGGESSDQIRIVNSMIAMSDDNWESSKLAIGRFNSDEIGSYFGVNAEVIGGKLIVGNNLILENETDEGVMQFKVDSSGAWLNNSTFVLQKDNGGKILIDPRYGIVAGTESLFTTDGTTVSPSFIDEGGSILFDESDMPNDTNFYLDIQNGNAYFRGQINAESGNIGGFTIKEHYLHAGSGSNYVALNGSGSDTNSLYAIWAGGETPGSAKFYVKKDGTLYAEGGTFAGTINATSGTFSGIVNASTLNGNLTAADDAESWIEGCGLRILDGSNPVFQVDQNGNVIMKGSIELSGNITWGADSSPVKVKYSTTGTGTPATNPGSWHDSYNSSSDYFASYSYDGGSTWTSAVKIRGEDGDDGRDGSDGSDGRDANLADYGIFKNTTDISGSRIYSPMLLGKFGVVDINKNITGYMGYATGGTQYWDENGKNQTTETHGIAMHAGSSYDTISSTTTDPYMLVTDYGVKMSCGSCSLYVTENGAFVVQTDGTHKLIGSGGGGTTVAVFG